MPRLVTVDAHPLLELRWFEARWPAPLGELACPAWLDALVRLDDPPLPAPGKDDPARVRELLRHGGFRPSGRSKPCNEYIRNAAADGRFPRINPAVDLTNLAALHGGLPVSTVDPDRLGEPLRVGLAAAGTQYVFNASGQVIDTGGLLCLFDAEGPCANAVKDAQRAKTTPASTSTLTLVWGTAGWPGRADLVLEWHVEHARRLGAELHVPLRHRSC